LLALDPQEQTGLMSQLLDVFEGSLRVQGQALEQAIATVDIERIRRTAHTVRSSSLSMGAESFAAACLELERSAQAYLAAGPSVEGGPQAVLAQAAEVRAQALALLVQLHRAQAHI
jgi:HPt (histidine-containing phosphotransfer) domain-containing protein